VKIFVSYSRRDANDFAEKISETLEDEHSVFTDVSNIQVGEDWSNTIEDNIASCDIFILIVTFAALKSKEVEKEILQAQNKNKKIIPCFYSGIKGNELKWGIGKLQGIEFANENQLARNIYGKIKHLVQLQSKLDTTIQGTAEPVKESKQDRIKNTEVPTEEEIKPEVPKAEVQPKIESPVVPHAKSPRVEQKYRLSSKRTVVLVVAIGAIIAAIFSVYVSVYLPQQVKVNVTTTPQLITPSQPTTIAEQQQYSFLRAWGSSGSGDGQFSNPQGVAVDSSGDVYVTDEGNDRIQKFTSDGKFITTWGSSGSGDGQFSAPQGASVDSSGNVYVADDGNDRIQKFTSDGKFITTWGSNGRGDGQFSRPEGVAVDSSGNVYVADYNNDRIQKFTSDGKFITTWGSSGSGEGQFSGPGGVAVDSSGNVYVSEFIIDRIQMFKSSE